jgi:glycerophosphoryl diester phosphodiesterase
VKLRGGNGPLLIGHKGAGALEPENTLASLSRAVELGCDLVEFDVLDVDGHLVLGHSLPELAPHPATFDEALELLGASNVGLLVDLKWHGYEAATVEAIRRHGLAERVLVSSCHAHSVLEVARLAPELARGITYPYDRHGFSERRGLAPLTAAALITLRTALPARIDWLLDRAGASVAVLYHAVVSPGVVERAHERDAAVLAWTVDEQADLERVLEAGVDGVVTNDPRIFPRPH